MRIAMLVTAAGSGRRFGGGNKLLQPLAGRPLLAWTLAVFEACPAIDDLYLTAPRPDQGVYEELLAATAPRTGRKVFVGGAERQQSIYLALAALAADPPAVIGVHDGARPLLQQQLLAALLAAGRDAGAIPGLPPTDTIKRVVGPHVRETLRRHGLVAVQTPQVFPWSLLWSAHQHAHAGGTMGTDDASLVEQFGGSVRIVPGDVQNLKVTTPMDLWLAEKVLADRQR